MDTTNTSVLDELKSLGFQPGEIYPLQEDPMEASRKSVETFIRSHQKELEKKSFGQIHITGPAVHDHSAPIKVVGNLLSCLQDGIDAIGARICKVGSDTGALPKELTDRTRLSLSASPLPGSIVINVIPEYSEQNIEGKKLNFDEPSLSDIAFKQLLELISSFSSSEKENNDFIDNVAGYGSRVATALSKICETTNAGQINVDMEWIRENGEKVHSRLTQSLAGKIAKEIRTADIKSEQEEIEGTLITLTRSKKDKLRISTGGNEEKTVSLGDISLDSINSFHVGDKVRIKLEKTTSKKVGGKTRETLTGISMSNLSIETS